MIEFGRNSMEFDVLSSREQSIPRIQPNSTESNDFSLSDEEFYDGGEFWIYIDRIWYEMERYSI
jgi:hypothetical protein